MKKTTIISLLLVLLLTLTFVSCSSTVTKVEGEKSMESYSLVGYDYLFLLDGNEVTFKYVDAVSADEVNLIASTLMAQLPNAKTFSNPKSGEIVILTKNALSLSEFDAFVENAKALIYDTIY